MQQKNSNDNSAQEIAELCDTALQYYKEGHLQKAQNVCQQILHKHQRPDAILILAKIAHEQREFEVAVDRYQQFLSLVPDHAQTHFYLGVVLEELCGTEPGQTLEAIEHYKKSIDIVANDSAVHSQLGDAYTKLQHWEQAIEAYQHALAINADDAATTIKLGNAFVAAQLFTQSILLYEQALTTLPDNALVYRHLGASLQKMGQMKKAMQCFEHALRLHPDYVEARIDLARMLRHLGRAEQALVQFEQVVGLKPDETDAHIDVALTLRQLGENELAVERLEQFLSTRPTCGEAYYHISLIKPEQALIPEIEALMSQPDLPKSDAIYCHFALGNFFDSDKSFDQAFRHYQRANTLQRETITYDAKENRQTVDSLIRVYSADFVKHKNKLGSASQLPVFIVGMPRSGTTLVEQILASHALVYGAGELDAFPGINQAIAEQQKRAKPAVDFVSLINESLVEQYSARYLQELTFHSPDASRITDKQPLNFVRIGLIKTLFPDARIIHCQRNPYDNCISLFFHHFTPFTCSFELTELAQYYLDYQRLMSHWHNLYADEIFTVRYEELVVDQERVSRQLIDYLGLDWDDKCLDFHNSARNVMSPSNMQVRQPIYKNSMNKWKNYEKHIQPLVEMLHQVN